MNRCVKVAAAAVAFCLSVQVFAQKTVFTDASAFPLYGKAIENTYGRYTRFPASYESVSRAGLWKLSRQSAGLYIRFRSDSKAIMARWESTFVPYMNHMTPTGYRGLDLYAFDGGKWYFAGSGRPGREKKNEAALCRNMDGSMREYILYLSLYDGIDKLEIGVDSGSVIEKPELCFPSDEPEIVMYGTSILQGGCANRPGMAFTAIIGRETGREVVNLGFSGNGKLDYEVAELMTQVENPGVFVLDYVPNCEAGLIDSKGEKFFRILRDARPDVPVIFVENPVYPHSRFDLEMQEDIRARNASQAALYQKLKKSGEKRIYYVKGESLIGHDGEATVDGIHFTDLGMVRYTDALLPVIRKALKK